MKESESKLLCTDSTAQVYIERQEACYVSGIV
jgi:hypothetical protein